MPPHPSGPMARLSSSELKFLAMLAGAGISTTGRVFWVKAADDADYDEFSALVPKGRLYNDIQLALDACRSWTNDYVMICPQDAAAGWALTTTLSMIKPMVHLIGIGRQPLITSTVGAAVIDASTAAVGIEIANLEITGLGAANTAGLGTAGSKSLIRDCRITAATGGAAALFDCTFAGDRVEFHRCTFGQRTAHAAEFCLDTTSLATNAQIIDCFFSHFAGAVGDAFINFHNSNGLPMFIKNCMGVNANLAVNVMTAAIKTTASNLFHAHNCGWVGAGKVGTTGKGNTTPGAVGNAVLAANVFDPSLAIDVAATVAVDT